MSKRLGTSQQLVSPENGRDVSKESTSPPRIWVDTGSLLGREMHDIEKDFLRNRHTNSVDVRVLRAALSLETVEDPVSTEVIAERTGIELSKVLRALDRLDWSSDSDRRPRRREGNAESRLTLIFIPEGNIYVIVPIKVIMDWVVRYELSHNDKVTGVLPVMFKSAPSYLVAYSEYKGSKTPRVVHLFVS